MGGLRSGDQTNQVVEVFADLSDDPGEGGPEQLLHVVRPRAIPVVCLQVVNPLKNGKGNWRRKILNEGLWRQHTSPREEITFCC